MTPCQVINVIEKKEFRDFALYGRDNISDCDLPHRTKLIELIFKTYEKEHRKLLDDFKVLCSGCYLSCDCANIVLQTTLARISFTSDCWSDPNLTSFLALTAHFMA